MQKAMLIDGVSQPPRWRMRSAPAPGVRRRGKAGVPQRFPFWPDLEWPVLWDKKSAANLCGGGNGNRRSDRLHVLLLSGGSEMKITYDSEVDALSIVFCDTTVTTKELAEGIAADYDGNGNLAGIEILDARQ